jgi:glycosyltransferase involved in cell wall biosynthesis
MRIVFDHQIFSRQVYGGISRYFQELNNRIPALGAHQAEIFAPLHINGYAQGDARPPRGMRLRNRPGVKALARLVDTVAGHALVRPRRDVDVFHQTYYAASTYAPRSARRIVTVYDMIHELHPDSFPADDDTPRRKQRAVAWADHVLCISETTRQDLIRILGVAPDKATVVHLGHSLLPGQAADPAADPVAGAQGPYLLYVGARGGYKNFDRLLAAYADSAPLREHVALVCFGGGGFDERELAALQARGVAGRVRQVSGSDALLSRLYTGAQALVYPSLYEGFGIPPIEAMAHGCPVVCSRAGSIPEVVGDAGAYFDPLDTQDIRATIEDTVASGVTRERLVALGRERARQFSWDACARGTLAVYARTLGA